MKTKHVSSFTAIILALFVAFPTIISVWIDGQLKTYQEKLLELEIVRSNYIQLGAYHDGRCNAFEITGAISAFVPKLNMEAIPLRDMEMDPDEKALFKQYESKRFTVTQYLKEMGNLARRKKKYYSDRVKQVNREIQSLHVNPPSVSNVKKWLPLVQVVGVILVVLTNVRNLNESK